MGHSGPGRNLRIFCAEQITVPPPLPDILKVCRNTKVKPFSENEVHKVSAVSLTLKSNLDIDSFGSHVCKLDIAICRAALWQDFTKAVIREDPSAGEADPVCFSVLCSVSVPCISSTEPHVCTKAAARMKLYQWSRDYFKTKLGEVGHRSRTGFLILQDDST